MLVSAESTCCTAAPAGTTNVQSSIWKMDHSPHSGAAPLPPLSCTSGKRFYISFYITDIFN